MSRYICIVQAGQAAEGKKSELAAGLERIGIDAFGDAPGSAEIRWVSVEEGYGFTAGQPSTSSLIVRSVPVGLPDDERERFMTRVCEMWEEVTGCTTNEVVVTAFDGPLPL